MEIMRTITFLGFLVFCIQIVCKHRQLKRNGIFIATRKKGLKSAFTTSFLVAFFLTFTTELILQTLQISFTVLPHFLNEKLHHTNALTSFGALFVVLAVICMQQTLYTLKNSLRFGINANNLGELITCGIFSRSRNPFFVSIILLFVGITLVFPTAFFAIITGFSIPSIHFFILKEEKFMRENYGKAYLDYCKTVRRYF